MRPRPSSLTTDDLRSLGYVETSPGQWARAHRPVGAVAAPVFESDQVGALEREAPPRSRRRRGPDRRPRVRLEAHLRKLMDSDNLIAGLKPLRDAVAAHLGCDDSDAVVQWQYAQCPTDGAEGVVVLIER